jgi:hypothetical protein
MRSWASSHQLYDKYDAFSQTASYSDSHTADHAPGRIPDLNHTPEASRAHPRYLLTPFREREPHVAGPTGRHVCGGEGKSDPPGGPSLRVTAQAIRTAVHEREHLDLVDTLSDLGE